MKLSRYQAYDKAKVKTGWADRHNQALINPKGVENGIVALLTGLEEYIEQYQERYESALVNDYVLNKGLADIANGIRVFLNGELGRLDAGTIDGVLVQILTACGELV